MTEYTCATLENGLRVVSVACPHHHGAEVLVYLGVGLFQREIILTKWK